MLSFTAIAVLPETDIRLQKGMCAMRVGERLHESRKARGYTLQELAEKAGLSPSYLSEIEKGSKKPSLKSLERISHALGISPGELSRGEDKELDPGTGTRIRLFRKEKGMTLQDLAEAAGVSLSYICEVERAAVPPSIQTLKKIAEGLDAPVSSLFPSRASIGGRLKQVRQEKGLSQSELAREAGCSPGLVGQIEQEKIQPSLGTLEKMAKALDISPCYFIAGEEDMERLLGLLTPEVRNLLLEPEVQAVLRSLSQCSEKEFRFIMDMIRLMKQSRLAE